VCGLKKAGSFLVVACAPIVLGCATARAATGSSNRIEYPAGRASVAAYGCIYSTKVFMENVFVPPMETEPYYLSALALTVPLCELPYRLALESEGAVAYHFGGTGGAPHEFADFAASMNLRYRGFPWDRYMVNTLAFGEGASYATTTPPKEVEEAGESRRLLNYLMFEATLAAPSHPRVALFYRIHHRCGIYGAVSEGSSNYVGMGLRCWF
jgi:hypothetical protein